MEDNQGGGVGAFAEEEANKKRQKKEDSVSCLGDTPCIIDLKFY
jgi:hypothetical protein